VAVRIPDGEKSSHQGLWGGGGGGKEEEENGASVQSAGRRASPRLAAQGKRPLADVRRGGRSIKKLEAINCPKGRYGMQIVLSSQGEGW